MVDAAGISLIQEAECFWILLRAGDERRIALCVHTVTPVTGLRGATVLFVGTPSRAFGCATKKQLLDATL